MQDRKEEFPLLDKLIQFNRHKMVENKNLEFVWLIIKNV